MTENAVDDMEDWGDGVVVSRSRQGEVIRNKSPSPDTSFHKKIDPSWWKDFPPYKEESSEDLIIDYRDGGAGANNEAMEEELIRAADTSTEKKTKIQTPVCLRRRLSFGSNMSPEVANLRATPNMTPTKRILEKDDFTQVGTPPKRPSLHRDRQEKVTSIMNIPGIKQVTQKGAIVSERKNIINQLMGARPRTFSTPASFKGRKNKRATSVGNCRMRQQSIPSMWSPDPRDGAERKVLDEPNDGAIFGMEKEKEMDAEQVRMQGGKLAKKSSKD